MSIETNLPPVSPAAPQAVRYELVSMVSIWLLSAVVAILVEVFAPDEVRGPWLFVAAGLCVLMAFIVQLVIGQQHRFVARVAGSIVGAVVIIGIVALVAWIPRFIGG